MTNEQMHVELNEIVERIAENPQGLSTSEIRARAEFDIPHRRLRLRLQQLLRDGRVVAAGSRRWRTYRIPASSERQPGDQCHEDYWSAVQTVPALSTLGRETRERIRLPFNERKRVGYNRDFLEQYQPNITCYLSAEDKMHLERLGRNSGEPMEAGDYARRFLDRLLVDLSWNSSRLEGNPYSRFAAKRLIRFGAVEDNLALADAHMVLNHKAAIEYIVEQAEEVRFNRFHIQNLHAVLANGLLGDPLAVGRVRRRPVEIGGSTYSPLSIPQVVEESFEVVLAKAEAIDNPFEQAFFAMVHLPYLQPFEDVNKRVSRLAANIPFIRDNLAPLTFVDVPTETYVEGILAVYELNEVALLRDVFISAYQRSAEPYGFARRVASMPDPIRLKYRSEKYDLMRKLILEQVPKQEVVDCIAEYAESNIATTDRERFREILEEEIYAIHDGSIARYRITLDEFRAWDAVWNANSNNR